MILCLKGTALPGKNILKGQHIEMVICSEQADTFTSTKTNIHQGREIISNLSMIKPHGHNNNLVAAH